MQIPNLRLVDPTHTYIGYTRTGPIKTFWYKDLSENYVKYTNAPDGHKDFDESLGVAVYVKNQPSIEDRPRLYLNGKKLHREIQEGAGVSLNDAYDPLEYHLVWYAILLDGTFIYLDSDVRENLFLHVPYRFRTTLANSVKLRELYAQLLTTENSRDHILGLLLALVDQGHFSVDELLGAKVKDAKIVGDTAVILKRKVRLDKACTAALSVLLDEEPGQPLFRDETLNGVEAMSREVVYRTFEFVGVDPSYLFMWHATRIFSLAANRVSAMTKKPANVTAIADAEVSAYFGRKDAINYVDNMVRMKVQDVTSHLSESVEKALPDGVPVVVSNFNLSEEDEELKNYVLRTPLHV